MKKTLKSFSLISIVFLCLMQLAAGQGLDNLSSLNVDDLSDGQIRILMERAQSSGYSQSQLEVLARARGMSELQINKLRSRLSLLGDGVQEGVQELQRLREEPVSLSIDPFESIVASSESGGPEIFGRSIFNNPQISFEPSYNIPTPENYLLGPGDEIIIDVWGASEQNYQLTVSPEGSIRIPNLGPIYLNGLSIKSAERKVLARLKQIYSSLGQNTFADISLGQLKTIKVNIVGEVAVPGTYTMSSFSSVFTALYMAGGPSEDGTLRSIEVYRQGDKIEEIDLFKYLFKGQLSGQILRDQDVILVPAYETRVGIQGRVKRPGIYELKSSETVSDLLEYAGGFSKGAFVEELRINRINGIRRKIMTISDSSYETVTLINGDEILVGGIINEFENRVVVSGAVYRPGAYELTDNLTLAGLLNKAEGVKPDVFQGRGLIWRKNEDRTFRNIPFLVSEVVDGSADLPLNPNDSIIVQSIFDLQNQMIVSVAGEVRRPGSLQYADSLTVEDAIFLSGGFKESAANLFVEVSRRLTEETEGSVQSSEVYNFAIDGDLKLSAEASTFLLKPFDLVVVRKSPFFKKQEIVEVEGEVRFPGKYALKTTDERISDLLKRSGGLTLNAYPRGGTLIRRTEYFTKEKDDTDVATRIRREDLSSIFRRDTLAVEGQRTFRAQESIGIDLVKIISNPGTKHDLILKEGDVLSVPRELQTVRIRGEVLYPSTVRFDGSSKLRNYLAQSGGTSDNAKLGKSYVVYANGSAAKTKRFLWFRGFPKIEPGAEIIVPKKPQRSKLSTQEFLGISSAILSMVLVVDRISN